MNDLKSDGKKKINCPTWLSPASSYPILLFYTIICLWCAHACNEPEMKRITYDIQKPNYDSIDIYPTADTIHFPLSGDMNNAIRSLNLFSEKGIEYISFHDRRSESVQIYQLNSRVLIKSFSLKLLFPGKELYKTTVYCKNFDTIVVTNFNHLYLFDSSGNLTKSLSFLKRPKYAWATFENTTPPVFKGNILYTGVRPYVNETSFKALREWKVIYDFNMSESKVVLHYHLPETYQTNIYGYHFMDYSYCYNDRGNFVFSFPADTNIYESDLSSYHVAYFAKSQFQNELIEPVEKEELASKVGFFRSYLTRDSYGPVYYDRFNKRYLRVAKSKIEEADYDRNKLKPQRLIVFDDRFKIIGESNIDKEIALSYLFFTKNGQIFARTKTADEYALHFVRLSYSHIEQPKSHLTLNVPN